MWRTEIAEEGRKLSHGRQTRGKGAVLKTEI